MSQTRRSGFTLMELLAVMLLIITVMSMGVPAMFAAERKSYVNQAMTELLRIHKVCMEVQRELGARGIAGQVTLQIASANSAPVVNVTAPAGIDLVARFGKTPTGLSINSDEFVTGVTDNPASTPGSITWTYDQQTGFITGGTMKELTFRALPSGGNWKVKRVLKIYPQGYSEIP